MGKSTVREMISPLNPTIFCPIALRKKNISGQLPVVQQKVRRHEELQLPQAFHHQPHRGFQSTSDWLEIHGIPHVSSVAPAELVRSGDWLVLMFWYVPVWFPTN